MSALIFTLFLLAFINTSQALGGLRYIRPPTASRPASPRGLRERSGLESIEAGVVSWGNVTNSTTVTNAAIIPVVLSEDTQSYYSVITTGNASFRVALDTASSDFWLLSSACQTSACANLPRYQLAYQSPSFVPVNNNQTAFNISFADTTSANGFVAQETVQVANLTVPKQSFGVVTSSNVTLNDEMSGVLGLGFPRISNIFQHTVNGTPFFATMAQRGQLDYPLFGLSLTHDASGSLTLGAVDGSVVTNLSLIQWNEVVPFAPFLGSASNTSSYLQWTIPLSGLAVNGSGLTPLPTYPDATNNVSLALFDAGTPGIYGPYQDVSRIYSLIAGSRLVDETGQWVIPCDANETIAFGFGGHQFVMQPTDYLIGPTTETPDLCLSWPKALPPSSDGIDWQLGTPFLRTVYSIYSLGIDMKEPPMIGLYPLRNASAPVQSPDVVAQYFSSASIAIATELPNFLISTPSFSPPAYTFNTSIPVSVGEIVSSGLATSTYSPALLTPHAHPTAIPTVSPSPTLLTFTITVNGEIVTSVSTASLPSITLGTPPGWTSGCTPSFTVPFSLTLLSGFVTVITVFTRFL